MPYTKRRPESQYQSIKGATRKQTGQSVRQELAQTKKIVSRHMVRGDPTGVPHVCLLQGSKTGLQKNNLRYSPTAKLNSRKISLIDGLLTLLIAQGYLQKCNVL
jgi:hypothetical protein